MKSVTISQVDQILKDNLPKVRDSIQNGNSNNLGLVARCIRELGEVKLNDDESMRIAQMWLRAN